MPGLCLEQHLSSKPMIEHNVTKARKCFFAYHGGFRNLERGVQPLAREAQPKIWGCHAHFRHVNVNISKQWRFQSGWTGAFPANRQVLDWSVVLTVGGLCPIVPQDNISRVDNVKNQPPNFKQLTPCAWRAHWCLNNRTLKLYSQAYIASELGRNCFTWLRG